MAHAVLFQDAVAKSVGLNSTDLQCANLLLLRGPATPGELAEWSGLTAGGAITSVIDRLERAGLVRRSRDTVDRRRVVVVPDTQEMWQRVGPRYVRVADEWNAYLTPSPTIRSPSPIRFCGGPPRSTPSRSSGCAERPKGDPRLPVPADHTGVGLIPAPAPSGASRRP